MMFKDEQKKEILRKTGLIEITPIDPTKLNESIDTVKRMTRQEIKDIYGIDVK